MKINKYIGIMTLAATMAAATSCSDYDDYNETKWDVRTDANQTLWANISQNADLSDFARVIQNVDFSEALNTSHFYTVWAPLNGTFSVDSVLALDKKTQLEQFVKNHIAEYNHRASGKIDERIHTLNAKSYAFEGAGAYKFDNVALYNANLPSLNGLMHTLRRDAKFYPNLYEYFSQSEGIDSLTNYVKNYEYTYLDADQSVVGPIVNGKQTYIDSVLVTYNTLTRSLRAELDDEDSTYTMLLPTDEAWNKAYSTVSSTLKYITSLKCQYYASDGSLKSDRAVSYTSDYLTYLRDSLTKRQLVRNLIYSNNDYYNQWLEGNGTFMDTVRTTNGTKLSMPKPTFEDGLVKKIQMSNGIGRLVDTLAFKPWETYLSSIVLTGTSSDYRPTMTSTAAASRVTDVTVSNPDRSMVDLTGTNGGATILRYAQLEPLVARTSRPAITYYLPNVKSAAYNIYCVLAPASVNLDDSLTEVRPYLINFALNYCDANGVLRTVDFGSHSNDTSKVDTVYVGTHTFPVSYYGLSTSSVDYYPNLKLTTPYSFTQVDSKTRKKYWDTYARDYRIVAVILRPVERDKYYGKEY